MAGIFDSMDDYLAVPRVGGLVLSPDGSRLVASVQTLDKEKKRYVSALWQIDTSGGPARRLTHSDEGEGAPAFTPDGDLLFVSKRPGAAEKGGDEAPALWRLPAGGGEAEVFLSRPGGVGAALVARDAGSIVVSAPTLAGDADGDAARREARQQSAVGAVLHETAPVRHWDHDLGPDQDRYYALDKGDGGTWNLRDLTPDPGPALVETSAVLSDDGTILFTDWRVTHAGGRESQRVLAIDVASGKVDVVAADDEGGADHHDFSAPAIAPDGTWLAYLDTRTETPETCPSTTMVIRDWPGGSSRDLLPLFLLWPHPPTPSPGSDAVFFTADEAGHCPVFRVDVADGTVTRLTATGAYTDLCPSPDGQSIYALRSHIDSSPRVVRLDARRADPEPEYLSSPGEIGPIPGRLEEVEAEAPDGTRIRAWLARPEGDDAAPLLLWVHGGPFSSWNSWSWRWNPWLMVARGWAVLLPDPGLSTGYGDGHIQRAWGQWGPVPYADLMALVDETVRRPDIDAGRVAAMGGSYGGYMA
ncbi:MAG TPA: prolyl oligopeptidase family serine peptidase, partial [Acidimicrobiales bacterium]|nr:prolyl oligopeptidase family serine peptidase [Acidimicrobiales bacterium]